MRARVTNLGDGVLHLFDVDHEIGYTISYFSIDSRWGAIFGSERLLKIKEAIQGRKDIVVDEENSKLYLVKSDVQSPIGAAMSAEAITEKLEESTDVVPFVTMIEETYKEVIDQK